jgi:hypothetical protein
VPFQIFAVVFGNQCSKWRRVRASSYLALPAGPSLGTIRHEETNMQNNDKRLPGVIRAEG